jgi:hypothetical protein
MKYLDTMEPGGYPFDDVSINFLQQMHNDRDSFLNAVFGNLKIVKGIVFNSSTNRYSDGLITVNDKLYHFVGGAPQTVITKKTVETKRAYEDGLQKKAFINEFYEFGTSGSDVVDFSTLKRWYQYQPIIKEIKYVGSNVTNATLPEGWFIADGQNGTDNLKSKFIVGLDPNDVDYNAVGKTGGEKRHALTENEMPSHKHGLEDTGAYNDTGGGFIVAGNGGANQGLDGAFTDSKGGGQSHENRPPYYVMIIIQFVGI